jgi:hypothetical protein
MTGGRRRRRMAAGGFRLPGSPYEELVNIVVAYGTRDEASNPGDVGKLDSVHQSSVSRNNAFLAEIGVLRGEREKLITRRGRALALALARKDQAEIRRHWREIVATNEFLQNLVSAVKMREGMLYPTLQAYVAHAAGQPRNKPVMAGASAIVEILKAAGLLREEAGELVATFDELEEALEADEPVSADGALAEVSLVPEPDTSADEPPPEVPKSREEPAVSAEVEAGPPVSIHLHFQCTADEIEDLAPRLKTLIRQLSAQGSNEPRRVPRQPPF